MEFKEYMQKQVKEIQWLAKHKHISNDEAAMFWVKSGLAKQFEQHYRKVA